MVTATESRRDNALFVRFPSAVIEALDRLVERERSVRGTSNRSDVIRALILEADRRARKEDAA